MEHKNFSTVIYATVNVEKNPKEIYVLYKSLKRTSLDNQTRTMAKKHANK